MNPRLFVLAIPFVAGLLQGCDPTCIEGHGDYISEKKTFSDFSGVKLEIPANVQVTLDSVPSVIIEAESNILKAIQFKIQNDILTVSSEHCFTRPKPIKIKIHGPELTKFIVNGSGVITCSGSLRGDHFEFGVNGSGRIHAKVDAGSVYGGIKGSGIVELSGTANKQYFRIDGSGQYLAQNLASVNSELNIHGSGEMNITSIEDLKVKINGSGRVFYQGSPKTSINIDGSGMVNKRE